MDITHWAFVALAVFTVALVGIGAFMDRRSERR
jgi:hypothetical protein